MKKTVALLIIALAFTLPMAAGAEESKDTIAGPQPVGQNALDTSEALKKLAISMVVIIVLGVVAVYVTKKVMPKVNAAMGKELRVVESLSLGPRKQVHVLKVGPRKLLVGAAAESITYLADVTEALAEAAKTQTEGRKNE